jgi:hypothetical protein
VVGAGATVGGTAVGGNPVTPRVTVGTGVLVAHALIKKIERVRKIIFFIEKILQRI